MLLIGSVVVSVGLLPERVANPMQQSNNLSLYSPYSIIVTNNLLSLSEETCQISVNNQSDSILK